MGNHKAEVENDGEGMEKGRYRMNAEGIMEALRFCYRGVDTNGCAGCPLEMLDYPCHEYNLELKAADIIESLLTQLAESQRREQAAVEDIRISHINMCAICKYEESAPEDGCVVNSNGNCDFVWRGPVED